nr:hypothetical protein [Tanacetum cinerariifolium]
MCDKKNSVLFTDTECLVLSPGFKLPNESQVLLRVPRENNMYNVNLKNIVPSGDLTCLFAKAIIDESNLWHRRLRHINFKTINKLVKGNLVRGLPAKVFENDNTCVACKKGKQHRASFVIDDYSRFTWVFFLATKDETSLILKTFITGLENQLSLKVKVIRSGNGTEFKNNDLNQFCGMKGIKREFSVPRTPQQNGITERKNRTIIEAARTMLADSLLSILFWAEAVNTACYVQNRVLVTKPHNKTPYELLLGRTPIIGFMRPFGCLVAILNTLDSLGKFNGKVDEGFSVGYSVNSSGPTCLFDIDSLTRTMNYQPVTTGNQSNPSAGFQDKFDAEKAREEINQQYVLFPVWSSGSTNPQNTDGDVVFDGKEPKFDEKKPESKVNVSPSSSAQSRKQDDKTKKEAKGKSPVESFTGYRDLSAEFEDCSDNSINEVNAAGTLVPTVGQNSPNSTNPFSAGGPSNTAASPTHGKSSFIDASQLLDDFDMPELEDITYSDDEDDVVNVSPSSSAQSRKQDDKTKKEAKGKSPVESFTGYRDLSAEFEDCSDNSINEVNAAGTLVPTVGQNSPNSTNPFSAGGPSNTAASPTHGKSSFIDASQLLDDFDMPELEDITYSDDEDNVGAEADFNNLEKSIIVSPIPTTRVHKDHHVSQIIGDLSSTTQTRSMTRVSKDQGGLSQMFNNDFHTCMFACFLSQEEPKRVHQAFKDPSWIEAMQEELLQFKM